MQVGGSLADDSTQSRSKLFSFGHLVHPRAASCWVGPCPVRCLYHYLQVTLFEFPEPQDSASGDRLPANGIFSITLLDTLKLLKSRFYFAPAHSAFVKLCPELSGTSITTLTGRPKKKGGSLSRKNFLQCEKDRPIRGLSSRYQCRRTDQKGLAVGCYRPQAS